MVTSITTKLTQERIVKGPNFQRPAYPTERSHRFIVWTTLIAILLPPVTISVGGLNFTPGRLVVGLFLVPALITMLTNNRRTVASDYSAMAAAAWMLGSSYLNGGFRPYVGAEAIDFFGIYLVGRAFFYGPTNLQTFSRALKFIVVFVIALAMLDPVSGRMFTMDALGIVQEHDILSLQRGYRFGLERASSVFEAAELFGTFCVASAAIFLYSERSKFLRMFYVVLSFLGVALSMSSGPYLGASLVAACYFYDRILQKYSWRWKALTSATAGLIFLSFLVSNDPIVWIISHLTFNPQTGFFRVATWDISLSQIGNSPWVGYGLQEITYTGWKGIFMHSVDCVWLVEALRYGVPIIFFMILTIFLPFLKPGTISTSNPDVSNIRPGFSLAVIAMCFIGLTVHYWNSAWLFFNLCIAIRASFAECGPQWRLRQRNVGAEGSLFVPAGRK